MFVMNSNAKGDVAEQAIVFEAVRLGVPILRPVGEHGRCDLAFDIANRIWRAQCKWGRLSRKRDVVIAKIEGCWCSPSGYVRSTYSEDEIDLLAIYCGELNRSFLLPAELVAGKHEIWLRLTTAGNNQKSSINLAEDFDFVGAIAQLGERVTGSHEVAGSSPASSTAQPGPFLVGCDDFRNRFSHWLDRVAAGQEILVTYRGTPRVRLTPPGSAAPLAAVLSSRAPPEHSAHSPVMISSAP
jgi:prevent-host-death family protein